MIQLYLVVELFQHHVYNISWSGIHRDQIGIGEKQPLHTITRGYRFQNRIGGEIGELRWIFCILQEILYTEFGQPRVPEPLSNLLETPSFGDRNNEVVRLAIE